MIVAGAFVLLFGTAFVIVAGVFALLRLSDSRLLSRLRRALVMTCAQLLTARSLPREVLVRGRTAAGPEGVLIAPAFGTPCAWYETEVSHDDAGDTSTTLVREVRRAAGIALTDPSGVVLMDPILFAEAGTGLGRRSQQGQLQKAAPGSGLRRLEESGRLRKKQTKGWCGLVNSTWSSE